MPDKYDSTTNEETGKEIKVPPIEMKESLETAVWFRRIIQRLENYFASEDYRDVMTALAFGEQHKSEVRAEIDKTKDSFGIDEGILPILWYELINLQDRGFAKDFTLKDMAFISVSQPWCIAEEENIDVTPEDQAVFDAVKKANKKFSNFITILNSVQELKGYFGDLPDIPSGIPQLQRTPPEIFSMPNNKVMNLIASGQLVNAGEKGVLVSNRGNPKRVVTIVDITSNLPAEITLKRRGADISRTETDGALVFDSFDREVYNAICSEYQAGNNFVTIDMIYRSITGLTGTKGASKTMQSEIKRSIEKMRLIRADIDATEEARMYKLLKEDREPDSGIELKFNEDILILRGTYAKNGQNVLDGYEILAAPVLFRYAHISKQIISVPEKMLDIKALDSKGKRTSASASNTIPRIVIKNELARRIRRMQHDHKFSRFIGYEELFEKTRGFTPSSKDLRSTREYAELCFENWKQTGEVKGFRQVKKGSKITGVEISI